MSNVLQKAFYLNRPQDAVCAGVTLYSWGRKRLRGHCGAAIRGAAIRGAAIRDAALGRRKNLERASTSLSAASASLVVDWQTVLQNALYAAPAHLRANVSSVAAKPTPLLRPAQSIYDGPAANTRQHG